MQAATTLGRTPPRPGPVEVALVASLLAVAAGAWAVSGDPMGGMDAGPGTELGGARLVRRRVGDDDGGDDAPVDRPDGPRARAGSDLGDPAFVAGYLLTWAAVGMLGWAFVDGVRSLDLGVLAWDEAGPCLAGGTILAAAIYQLSPLKNRSLRPCRNPRAFVSEHWRPGRVGALRMGIGHGRVCAASSSALMAALFALGVMSVGWMVLVAALIAAEKLLPWQEVASRGTVVILAVLAVGVAFAPDDVPGLTIPGSPAAMKAMERMGTDSMEPARPMQIEDGTGAMPQPPSRSKH